MNLGAPTDGPLPPRGTLDRWCADYVRTVDLESKLAPPPPPRSFASPVVVRRLAAPARPRELRRIVRAAPTPRPGAFVRPQARARIVHSFLHHEIQAAELMCWAALAFADRPAEFRRGLIGIASDEIAHARAYRGALHELGFEYGDFPVRDWFWERVPACPDARAFVALMGMGLEAGNLEHAARFAESFRAAGDARTAAVIERIGAEEVAHVRFAVHWFTTWNGGTAPFASWVAALPPPLSPLVLHAKPLARAARAAAGFSPEFLDELDAWAPSGS